MRFGFKFCGGCNPRYDRVGAFENIKKYFCGRANFEKAEDGNEYDGLLVIGGCTNCCPAISDIKTKTKPVLLWDASQYENAIKQLEEKIREVEES